MCVYVETASTFFTLLFMMIMLIGVLHEKRLLGDESIIEMGACMYHAAVSICYCCPCKIVHHSTM